jgi:hypothetical protein
MILSVILEILLSHFIAVSVILLQYSIIFMISSDILEISSTIFVIFYALSKFRPIIPTL